MNIDYELYDSISSVLFAGFGSCSLDIFRNIPILRNTHRMLKAKRYA
jgi:hypothetical protein